MNAFRSASPVSQWSPIPCADERCRSIAMLAAEAPTGDAVDRISVQLIAAHFRLTNTSISTQLTITMRQERARLAGHRIVNCDCEELTPMCLSGRHRIAMARLKSLSRLAHVR